MALQKSTYRNIALLLALNLSVLNLTGWRVIADSSPTPLLTTAYFNDFNGKSGGVPADWADIGYDSSPESTVVEKGTVVAITDIRKAMTEGGGPQLIQSNFRFAAPSDPAATVTLTANIASTTTNTPSEHTQVVAGLGNVNGYAIIALFDNANNTPEQFKIILVQDGIRVGVFPLPQTSSNIGYAGGQIDITLMLKAYSLRLISGAYDSGDVPYTSASVTGFNSLADLGTSVGIILGASAEGDSSGDIISTVNFDSVLLDMGGISPSPQQQLNSLISQVDNLQATGLLTPPQANVLKNKLSQAVTKLDHGQIAGACSLIDDFINQVNSYVIAGILNAITGQALVTDASSIKTNIGC